MAVIAVIFTRTFFDNAAITRLFVTRFAAPRLDFGFTIPKIGTGCIIRTFCNHCRSVSAIIGISLFAFGRTVGKRFLTAIRGLNRSPVAAVVGIGFLADASAGSGIISFTAVRS